MTKPKISYPELREKAEFIANMALYAINSMADMTESKMPYKAQFILECVIEILEAKV